MTFKMMWAEDGRKYLRNINSNFSWGIIYSYIHNIFAPIFSVLLSERVQINAAFVIKSENGQTCMLYIVNPVSQSLSNLHTGNMKEPVDIFRIRFNTLSQSMTCSMAVSCVVANVILIKSHTGKDLNWL
jgi:hypothetical protein